MSDNVFSLLGFESKDFVNHPKIWYDRVHPDDLRHYLARAEMVKAASGHFVECHLYTG